MNFGRALILSLVEVINMTGDRRVLEDDVAANLRAYEAVTREGRANLLREAVGNEEYAKGLEAFHKEFPELVAARVETDVREDTVDALRQDMLQVLGSPVFSDSGFVNYRGRLSLNSPLFLDMLYDLKVTDANEADGANAAPKVYHAAYLAVAYIPRGMAPCLGEKFVADEFGSGLLARLFSNQDPGVPAILVLRGPPGGLYVSRRRADPKQIEYDTDDILTPRRLLGQERKADPALQSLLVGIALCDKTGAGIGDTFKTTRGYASGQLIDDFNDALRIDIPGFTDPKSFYERANRRDR
jgi:hypothetical protein